MEPSWPRTCPHGKALSTAHGYDSYCPHGCSVWSPPEPRELETAASIERDMRREWGEAAMLDPVSFRAAVLREVCKVDEDGKQWRSVMIRGTFGPHGGDDDYYPISCCAGGALQYGLNHVAVPLHEPDCFFTWSSLDALLAAGGVMSFPPQLTTIGGRDG